MKRILLLLPVLITVFSHAQDTGVADTTVQQLGDVVVRAYELNQRAIDVAAAINHIGSNQLNRYGNKGILPAMNSLPGVRMEERSPGSYRVNIRGSSQRAPFGVRNVKIYYNNIPFTDPGGNSYLNQLGFHNFQSIEVIKGPGSSLYGAGTGGVLLIQTMPPAFASKLDYSFGSFGAHNMHVAAQLGKEKTRSVIAYNHQVAEGYRMHAALRRDVFTWDAETVLTANTTMRAHLLYGDMRYQTPGGLTAAEYAADPTQPRPTIGASPGAVATRAAIYQKMFLAAATLQHAIDSNWNGSIALYGAYTQLRNPTFRNYGRTAEPHFGSRAIIQYRKRNISWHAGLEAQQGFITARSFGNRLGNPDTLQTDDEVSNRNLFIFTQAHAQLGNWLFTAGISINQLNVRLTRLYPLPYSVKRRNYNNEVAPRLSILRKIAKNLSIYAAFSKGFSPPNTSELLPSTGVINTALEAEQGFNYEMGLKGKLLDSRLFLDLNVFYFRLGNTIVQRRDATGGDYFINSGAANQFGVETMIDYAFSSSSLLKNSRAWVSHTLHDFHYGNFIQVNNDFSGNRLPGVARHTIAAGIDLALAPAFGLVINHLYVGRMPLNDANAVYADEVHVLGTRLQYRVNTTRVRLRFFIGGDNLFNEAYSLGNDVNAFSGRYFNAAPARNYYVGLSFQAF
jgi:iron complex outermembrane receptor protein